MMNDNAKQTIQLRGRELGLDIVRVAPAVIDAKYQDTFERWVGDGLHGSMEYLARRVTNNVTLDCLLPDVKSVVTVAVNYYQADQRPPAADEGLVSRYAVTRDYHKVIGKALKKLAIFVDETFPAQSRAFVDIGPVLERAFAEAAGVGYVGRNTMLINGTYGSWVFLGVVLTTLELEPDTNDTKLRCGSCRRCVDDCPTAAIRDDHTLDARRCISYLTIENRGPIPVDLRPLVGNWLFGCDICQEVCPHNSRESATRVEDFQRVRIHDRVLALTEVLEMRSYDAFLERFAGTPLMRAKREGLLRNACVVAGNSGDRDLLDVLCRVAAEDSSDMVREHAEWAVDRLRAGT
jgi:epoxyqueuosine reductase